MESMTELFYKARKFGRVAIHTHDDGTYSCNIVFNTINHVELKAQSGYDYATAEEAIDAAIKTAVEIINSITQTADNLKFIARNIEGNDA